MSRDRTFIAVPDGTKKPAIKPLFTIEILSSQPDAHIAELREHIKEKEKEIKMYFSCPMGVKYG